MGAVGWGMLYYLASLPGIEPQWCKVRRQPVWIANDHSGPLDSSLQFCVACPQGFFSLTKHLQGSGVEGQLSLKFLKMEFWLQGLETASSLFRLGWRKWKWQMNHCSDVIIHHFATFKISTNPIAMSWWLVTIPAIVHLKLTRRSYKPTPKMYA